MHRVPRTLHANEQTMSADAIALQDDANEENIVQTRKNNVPADVAQDERLHAVTTRND